LDAKHLAHSGAQCDLGQERDTAVTGDVAAAEISFNFTALNGWKFERSLVAFCHGGIFLLIGLDTLIFKIFPPFYYPLREIFGLWWPDSN
jgi:hypothetical protein